MNETTRQNLADLIAALARIGRDDPTIATRLGLTTDQVRRIRGDAGIAAGEQRWLRDVEAEARP